LDPDVEIALQKDGIVPRGSDDDLGSSLRRGLQLRQHGRDFVRSMFRVDDNPVEPGAGDDFRGITAAQGSPEANLDLLLFQRTLEAVGTEIHGRGASIATEPAGGVARCRETPRND